MLTKAGQELSNKGSPNLPGVVSRIKVFCYCRKKCHEKVKRYFISNHFVVIWTCQCFYSFQEGQSFFQIVETGEQIVRSSFNFNFFITAEEVEREPWKLCLTWRWLKPSHSDRSFIPLGLWQLNVIRRWPNEWIF